MSKRFFGLALLSAAAVALTACGGGGGGGDSSGTASAATFPLTTVLAHYVNDTATSHASLTGTGVAPGQSFSFSGSATLTESTVATTFEGLPALRKALALSGSLDILGSTISMADSTYQFFDSNYKPVGSSGTGSYCVTTSFTPPPATVRVGDSGNWFTMDCYTDSLKQVRIGSNVGTYSVEADTSTTALLKITSQAIDTAATAATTTQSFRIETTGSVRRVGETGSMTSDGITLNYQSQYF